MPKGKEMKKMEKEIGKRLFEDRGVLKMEIWKADQEGAKGKIFPVRRLAQ